MAKGGDYAHHRAIAMTVQAGVLLGRAGGIGWRNGLAAEDHRHADFFSYTRRAMLLSQPVTQLGQQRVMGGIRQVIDINQVTQTFASSCTHRDENAASAQSPIGHGGLGSYLIAGIHDGVHTWGQQRLPIVGLDKFLNSMNLAVWAERMDAVSHGENFSLPNGGVSCLNLTIDVGFAHVVQVNECQLSNATARKCLGRPGANTAYADHSHMRATDMVGAGLAIQAGQPAKAAVLAQAS